MIKKISLCVLFFVLWCITSVSFACGPKPTEETTDLGNSIDIHIDDSDQTITPKLQVILDWLEDTREGKGPKVLQLPTQ